jgi:hypothetical protein
VFASLIQLGSVAAAIIAAAAAVIAYRHSIAKDTSAEFLKQVGAIVSAAMVGTAELARKNESDIKDINARVAPVLTDTSDKIGQISDRVSVLETKIEVFWRNVAYDAAKILHSPHRPVLDALLEKFYGETITRAEEESLRVMLIELTGQGEFTPSESLSAAILLRFLESDLPGMTPADRGKR